MFLPQEWARLSQLNALFLLIDLLSDISVIEIRNVVKS